MSNNKGWLIDYAILKKKIVKKTEKNNNEESFVQSGREKKNSVDARIDQLLTGYDYVKKMKR